MLNLADVVKMLNPIIRGWRGYLRFGNSTAKLQDLLDHFAYVRLKKFFCNKHGTRANRVLERFRWWWPQSGLVRFYVPGACGRVL